MTPQPALLSLAENSPLLFFIYAQAAEAFIYVNAACLEFFGLKVGQLTIAALMKMVHNDDQLYIRNKFVLLSAGSPIELECRCVRDGHERTLRIHACITIDNGQQLVTGHAEDITAYHAYSRTLAAHGNKKNAILNILTHDLIGPIGSIGNFCDLIRREMKEEVGQRLLKHIDSIQKISKSCIRLMRDFIDQEFLESTAVSMVKRRIDLAAKLNNSVKEYQAMRKELGLNVVCNAHHGPVYVALDEDKFMQVIQNLILNALKFTPEGGTITLDLAEEEQQVIVSLADTGIGIPAKYHATLFDKFSDARRKGLHGEKSTGLGMSIIKTIVEWHEGKIWFESEENVGTTFYISLPKT